MDNILDQQSQKLSQTKFFIEGIEVHVYGIKELPKDVWRVTCMWLLHPRLKSQEHMIPIGNYMINHWYQSENGKKYDKYGMIGVTFDLRNHGKRVINADRNLDWKAGNKSHAMDMFSIIRGSFQDLKLLIENIPSLLASKANLHPILSHMVLGVSLGGHLAWQSLVHIPEIEFGVVIIGSCDFVNLMYTRLDDDGTDPDSTSSEFPISFDDIEKHDLTQMIRAKCGGTKWFTEGPGATLGCYSSTDRHCYNDLPAFLRKFLGRKMIVNISGGQDKLVPASCSRFTTDLLRNLGDDVPLRFFDFDIPEADHRLTLPMVKVAAMMSELAVPGWGSAHSHQFLYPAVIGHRKWTFNLMEAIHPSMTLDSDLSGDEKVKELDLLIQRTIGGLDEDDMDCNYCSIDED